MSVLFRGYCYLLQLKRDNGVWNAFWNSKALPKQKVSYCAVIYRLIRHSRTCFSILSTSPVPDDFLKPEKHNKLSLANANGPETKSRPKDTE